jgi:predicted short-subunit dehydrogenase-like oxidoreductase (DUF2520 family)
MAKKASITIVGAGNVASVLGPALRRAGYRIDEIVSRSNPHSVQRAKVLARKSGAAAATLERARFSADIVWNCVTDDAIAPVSLRLAARRDVDWKGKIIFHASGALTSDALTALKKRGAAVASTHFMQTFMPGSSPTLSVPFSIEGDKQAQQVALEIGHNLEAKPFIIRKQSRVLYHAMGSFASPQIIASLSLAEAIGRAAGLDSKQIESVIGPIFSRTAENYLKNGSSGAYRGPINRGDAATVKKHLQDLKKVPEARAAYVALGKAALKRLPVKNRKQLQELFRKA